MERHDGYGVPREHAAHAEIAREHERHHKRIHAIMEKHLKRKKAEPRKRAEPRRRRERY